MSEKHGLFSRLFTKLQKKPSEKNEQAQAILANYQREVAESNFDAEQQLGRALEQLRPIWGLDTLEWAKAATGETAGIKVLFSGENFGGISWAPHDKLTDRRRETLEILAGLAGPHLYQFNQKETTALDEWHSKRADPVTGLLKRPAFLMLLSDELSRVTSNSGLTSVLVAIQIPDYDKIYNEIGGLGYDERIQGFSNLLKTTFGIHSTAGRIEEDVFVVFVSDITDPDKVSEMCRMFRKRVEEKLSIDTLSGMAPQTEAYTDPKVWLNDARTALKQLQKNGGKQAFFSETMQMHSIARWRMESDLELALAAGQLETWFQPIVTLGDGEIAGYEALCRWTHPQKGPISPAEFIPVAENDGPLILEIGKLTLNQACEALLRVTEKNKSNPFMSINLSPVQLLKDRLLPQHMKQIFKNIGVEPHKIKFEITETAVMHDKEKAIEALKRIRQTGAQVSMDDFGTGYSSLAHLKEFPINTLKIDRAFVDGADLDGDAGAMLKTIIDMAHGLNLDVVAEGIETEGERDLLINLGCEYGQGWLFSKPLPPEEL
ncbi:MAG: hypothetical protein CMJ93_02610 [Planctomycetes bacterium]|nr:hypothetical protein [Planctomycetota bacterium]